MANKETKLSIIIDAQNKADKAFNETEQKLKGIGTTLDNMKPAFGTMAIAGGAAFAGLSGFILSSVKAAGEAQVAMAKVDATLEAMDKTTRQVVIGTTTVAGALKLSGLEAQEAQNKISALNIRIEASQSKLKDLSSELKKGEISQGDYNIAVKSLNNTIEASQIQLQKYKSALLETDKATTVNITKSVKGLGESIESVKKKIMDASAATIRLGFDDEDTAVSITKLFQATGDLNRAMELNKLAMDLARAKGIDLGTASLAITRALGGNVRALKEFIPELDETVSLTDALRMAQERLTGQAEKAATTFPIQMEALSIAFTNVKESIGNAFLPILTELLVKLLPVVEKIGAWVEENPKLVAAITIAALAISGLVMVLGLMGLALIGINAVLPAIVATWVFFNSVLVLSTPVIAALVIAIMAVAFMLSKLGEVAKYTGDDWAMVWLGMKLTVAEWANAVVKIVEETINWVIGGINSMINSLNSLIQKITKIPKLGSAFKSLAIPTLEAVKFNGIDTNAMVTDAMNNRQSNPVNVAVTGNTFLDEDVAEKIGDLIINKLKLSNAI